MSASSKKKLRKENAAAALTEKQRKEQAEAKKLKAITISFIAVMLVIALTAASVLSVRAVNNSGIIDRNTIAAVTGEHKLNSVQMNYYFTDYIRGLYSQWETSYGEYVASYMSMMGLNLNAPLSEQKSSMATDKTWAEYFFDEALNKAKDDYALYDKAIAEGFKLSEDEQTTIDYNMQILELSAMYSGAASTNKYLQAIYGYGADVASYKEYSEITTIATAYYNKYSDSLSYNDAAIREHEKDKFNNYSSFSYAVYHVSANEYLEGGTTADDGTVTYTDAQKDAAVKAAEKVANELAASTNITELDKAISLLEVNAKKDNVASTKYDDVMYSSVTAALQEWLANSERKADDITVIPNETTTKDADGKETKTVNGYYVVLFTSRNDNLRPLANVRHLLVKFEGGTTDSKGNKTYSDTEKATAKAEAERLLQVWKDGNATEDTFIALVKEHSDDSSKDSGGLFEDIHPKSNYVDSFRTWSLDSSRKAGDTGVIVSEYGYHVMYYSSDDELTYRDYMISEDLRTADVEKWFNAIVEPATITAGKTNRMNFDLIIASIV